MRSRRRCPKNCRVGRGACLDRSECEKKQSHVFKDMSIRQSGELMGKEQFQIGYTYIPLKFVSIPFIYQSDYIDKLEKEQCTNLAYPYVKKNPISSVRRIFAHFITIIFIITAAVLSWRCNSMENIWIRYIYCFFASFFSFWYLLFYLIYRILMDNSCNNTLFL